MKWRNRISLSESGDVATVCDIPGAIEISVTDLGPVRDIEVEPDELEQVAKAMARGNQATALAKKLAKKHGKPIEG